MKGYKAFNKDWSCNGFKYEIGQTYKHDDKIGMCESGFHFCEQPLDVFKYYNDAFNQKYAEIEASGEIIKGDDKHCCSKIKIIKELTYQELYAQQFLINLQNIQASKETTNTSGYRAHANTSGYRAHANTSGDGAHANTSGDGAHANTSGYRAHANTSGDGAHANTSGDWAIACSFGVNSKSKANKGWIVLVDWQQDEDYNWFINEIYRAKVGTHKIKGVKIQPDTWYWFEDGELKNKKEEQQQ